MSGAGVEGPEHPITLYTMGNLAWLYVHLGKLSEAEPLGGFATSSCLRRSPGYAELLFARTPCIS